MKKIFFLLFLAGLFILDGCKSDPCKTIVTYNYLNPQMPNYFYKVGSFWVYRDSASGLIDSQYVYNYQYKEHFRDPADSPNKLYLTTGISGQSSGIYCGPYYYDYIRMDLISFQNGALNDTISFSASGEGAINAGGSIYDHFGISPSYSAGFFLDWNKIGFLDCCYSLTKVGASYDTTGSWYGGIQPNISSGPYNFINVYLWTIQLGDTSSVWFSHPTDLYITSGSGIIKIVQHLPTRDVIWNLINYHIVN